MPKRFQWTLIVLGVTVLLIGFFVLRGRGSAPQADQAARALLAAWKSQPSMPLMPGFTGLWTISAPTYSPGYDLSVGRLGSGRAIVLQQKRSDWCGIHQEHGYVLLQSEANQAVWQLSES